MNENSEQSYRRMEEQAFLPAALEVRDTPPSPIGRTIVWVILLFFILAILWAAFGKVDIVAVAQGKIIPSGHSKVIQPLEVGVIRSLHVKEGQSVKRGDILLELDPTTTTADLQRLQQDAAQLGQQIMRLERLNTLIQEETTPFDPAQSEKQKINLSSLQEKLLLAQWQEHIEGRQTLKKEMAKLQAQRATLEQQIGKLKATLPLITERADDMQTLLKTNAVARHRVLEVKQEKISAQHDLKTAISQRQELIEAEAEIETRIDHHQSQLRKQTMEALTDATQKQAAIEQEIVKAEVRTKAQILRSPVDGVVQQLAVHTIGGVVTPAQELMLIVPDEEKLEVEALLENKDIGFVEEGQQIEVKIDAFPFTKYGTIDGILTNISNDALMDEVKGLVFKTQVSLKKSQMQIGKRQVKLTPGMSVTVEIKTGKRRVIEFFLAPLLRYKQESIRER
ncbi:MAG: HlyD family type I secretion periplasmic adaptor subunit [Candidatus Thiodiazotropha sp. (ex Myrtea sp. 'scaly one' KF741663)]|nr:HlyD family type I secretion periplasmic adaptor subunit [Candidatus Thiodiazotropha sp. (ex Myrtea sp. 'scaly one' KF741663)]